MSGFVLVLVAVLALAASGPDELDEAEQVRSRRFDEAHAAGLTLEEAHVFADSDVDVGQLRKLNAAGCSPDTIRSIIL